VQAGGHVPERARLRAKLRTCLLAPQLQPFKSDLIGYVELQLDVTELVIYLSKRFHQEVTPSGWNLWSVPEEIQEGLFFGIVHLTRHRMGLSCHYGN